MRTLLVAGLVLGGCAGAPPSAASLQPPAPSIQQDQAPRFDRLTLDEALRLAEESHPAIEEARGNVRAAEGRRRQAGLLPNPELEARMEAVPFDRESDARAEPLVGVRQRIPLGGRLGAAGEAAEWDRTRSEHELASRRLEVRSRVRGSFASALFAGEAATLLEETFRIAAEAARVVRARAAAGDALPEESARAELEEVRARIERDRGRSLRRSALDALAAAIGDARIRIAGVEGNLEAALDLPALEAILASLASAPSVEAARADVAAAEARLVLARAQRIPDLSLEFLYRRLGAEEESAFDAGLGVAIPLFDSGRGRVGEARGDAAAARARLRHTTSEAEARIREGHARLARALEHARTLKAEVLPRADVVVQAMEARVAAGDAGTAEAAPVRRERAALGLAWLEALREALEAWAALEPYLRKP